MTSQRFRFSAYGRMELVFIDARAPQHARPDLVVRHIAKCRRRPHKYRIQYKFKPNHSMYIFVSLNTVYTRRGLSYEI